MGSSFDTRQKILALKDQVIQHFTKEDWLSLGLLTGYDDQVRRHDRLLRSLYFGDDDYAGEAINMLLLMVSQEERNLSAIEAYVDGKYGPAGANVSSVPSIGRRIYFTPNAFQAPIEDPDPNLISVMMPFDAGMTPVFDSIKWICDNLGWKCQRASDIWQHSTVIQDIFSLIYRSHVVVCDFSGKNPNVFYEAGIAHTLGKHVVPLAQQIDDIPFDLRHHRALIYLRNQQGLDAMQNELWGRLNYLMSSP